MDGLHPQGQARELDGAVRGGNGTECLVRIGEFPPLSSFSSPLTSSSSQTIERNPTYDEATKQWTVNVVRENGEDRVLKVNHLVLASGFSGEARLPKFDKSEFKGYLTHSSGHGGCHKKGWEGKKAVVIGVRFFLPPALLSTY